MFLVQGQCVGQSA